jgi:creatinine amidohydrolase/Fe(II)-dependent formamide hydrolase-like protein
MAENTAREIWVNKLLDPNPFLVGPAAEMEPRKLERYLRARLVFDDAVPAPTPAWNVDRTRHAVLSSGGKDSLLSYALLAEMGLEPQPIFVNESGRHWYTALNAYREMSANVPGTARVWSSCDRVFTWMLRRLPFIRPDFAGVRADIYPVRLWTVAVFLVGALPLMKKRGIGRIVIGDEFDTSTRVNRHGITHYDGLYDQSRWFDNALTRHFRRKRWGVAQFSILRPLSEMLIQRILAERYPDVLRLQVSCHATHVEGDRVHPCGKCEKCRRIVGMLTAFGADPGVCGYTAAQIEICLKELRDRPVKQEAAGVSHLRALLAELGKMPAESGARRHPEIENVRFDAERSPVDAIPLDLRRPLLRIFLEHARGVVERHGRLWMDLDPKDPKLDRPYSLEGSDTDRADDAQRTERKRPWVLGELTWPEAKRRFKEVDLALLPVGALEQHGPHSPLDTDAYDAEQLALRVAERCADPRPLVLPLIPYGVSYHHEDFAGTISVSNEALGRFVYEVGVEAARNGIIKLIIINGHGGNAATLQFAAQMINRDAHIFTCVDSGETSDEEISKVVETPGDVHAGETETSTTLALRPHLVDMSKAKPFAPKFSTDFLDFSGRRSVEWYARTRRISPQGILGDPTKATAEKGERIWEIMVSNLVEMVEHLKRLSLDEIHERRY